MIMVTSQISRHTTWRDMLEYDPPASGDLIQFTLKNGETLTCEAAHDENGKLFIVFHDCLNDAAEMNKSGTNRGGWEACDMRKHAQKIFELFPDDLKAVIQPTKIVQVIGDKRIECHDKLFCLSATQVFGANRYWSAMEPEDTQLDIFKKRKARVKMRGNDVTDWWLRSPHTGSYGVFWIVNPEGSYNSSYAYTSRGVCFGFCIGEAIL